MTLTSKVSHRAVRGVAGIVVAAGALIGLSGPASATDNGSWHGSCDAANGCFWEGEINQSLVLGSNIRDSSFTNEYYANLNNHPLNDRVKVWNNSFSTIYIQSFLDSNYVRPTFCLPPGYSAGPYPFNSDGLSSFRSC